MSSKKFIGAFNQETELIEKMDELKAQGSQEEDFYVVVMNKDQLTLMRAHTEVREKSPQEDGMDKFKNFLAGTESVQKAFSQIGASDAEARHYYEEVQSGKMLLFADNELHRHYEEKGLNATAAYGDPLENQENSPKAPPAEAPLPADEHKIGEGVNKGVRTEQEATDYNIPSSGRDVVNIPTDDPNLKEDATVRSTSDVRKVDQHHIDAGENENMASSMPSKDPNTTAVPPAEQKPGDVPTGNQDVNRSMEDEGPESLAHSAVDRVRKNGEKR